MSGDPEIYEATGGEWLQRQAEILTDDLMSRTQDVTLYHVERDMLGREFVDIVDEWLVDHLIKDSMVFFAGLIEELGGTVLSPGYSHMARQGTSHMLRWALAGVVIGRYGREPIDEGLAWDDIEEAYEDILEALESVNVIVVDRGDVEELENPFTEEGK